MNNNSIKRNCLVLSWNIIGINLKGKSNAIKSKVMESNRDVLCLQETKRQQFDDAYIKQFCTPQLDMFTFLPSIGSSGGCIIIQWI
jgi:exonuclease III